MNPYKKKPRKFESFESRTELQEEGSLNHNPPLTHTYSLLLKHSQLSNRVASLSRCQTCVAHCLLWQMLNGVSCIIDAVNCSCVARCRIKIHYRLDTVSNPNTLQTGHCVESKYITDWALCWIRIYNRLGTLWNQNRIQTGHSVEPKYNTDRTQCGIRIRNMLGTVSNHTTLQTGSMLIQNTWQRPCGIRIINRLDTRRNQNTWQIGTV